MPKGCVPECWIVNPLTEVITVLRLQGIHEEVGTYRRGQTAVSSIMPAFSVAVDDVFNAD